MHNRLMMGVLVAAALLSEAAGATPIGTDDGANLVLDLEFWGRERLISEGPNNQDVISYGDPVRGTFRIWTADAPSPRITAAFLDQQPAVVYGRDWYPAGNPPPASFVTSHWLSPFPAGFAGDVASVGGGVADDYVAVADDINFGRPHIDWFEVSDAYSANYRQSNEIREELMIYVRTPLDIVHGLGVAQEFDFVNPDGDTPTPTGYGIFRSKADGVGKFISFIVDRLTVTESRVCRP